MRRRWTLLGCLVFSGLTALVYELLWTRLLGFVFGTTTEAIGTVLAIFFGGMALGNLLAARLLARVRRPMRLYALLELGIGGFALLSLPGLQRLDVLYAWFGPDQGPLATAALRVAAAAVVLLAPTVAMGATLPVVARGLVERDETRGRWSALLYTANTLGAVLGAYACGFWLLPGLGLRHTLWSAALLNLVVAATVLASAGGMRVKAAEPGAPVAGGPECGDANAGRGWFLLFFGVSGFVAIGYEIVWSKIFTIVMEGTIYGFSAVLAAFLLGIGLGSLAIAVRVDRIRDLPRAFGLLHMGIGVTVALGMLAVPYLPYALHRLAALVGDADAVHALFVVVAPLVLVPTALFGAAFPILIRIYTRRASGVGRGMGIATAVNTAGSILASLCVGFWWIPAVGIDATLYVLLLLDLLVALLVLARFQTHTGRERWATLGTATAIVLAVAGSFDGVRVERAVAGRAIEEPSLARYREQLERTAAATSLVLEGRTSIVTVHPEPFGRKLQTNGLPEAGVSLGPPYTSLVTLLLGALPYLDAPEPESALVIGYGGGATVDALRRTPVRRIDVVELEPEVIAAARELYRGRPDPLADPRVTLHINDGRNHLLRGRYRGGPGYDIIASQPSHPWLVGAANLFTEEFFALARDNLTPRGRFALWLNGFRTDPESVLAVMASFERVFPGSLVVSVSRWRPREALLLLGGREPVAQDLARWGRRMSEPPLATSFALHDITGPEDLLARVEGPTAVFAALSPKAANTDDNAFLETRIPRRLEWRRLDFGALEARLPAAAPLLPAQAKGVDTAAWARALLDFDSGAEPWPFAPKLRRLLRGRGAQLDPTLRAALAAAADLREGDSPRQAEARLRRLGAESPRAPEPLRLLARHLALRERRFADAAQLFASAWQRSHSPEDAYDAGRAWYWIDRREAWRWLDRIPPTARAKFPRLAFYAAERSLERKTSRTRLRQRFEALRRYRDTEEGRSFPGVEALLAQVAEALGDVQRARAYRDADMRQREERAAPALERARLALERRQLASAATALEEARGLVPSDPRLPVLEARLARARGDRIALEQALEAARRWAPTLATAIASENRLRLQLDLPLLPARPAPSLFAAEPATSSRAPRAAVDAPPS